MPSLERHGHLILDDATRAQLLATSSATADRILSDRRPTDRRRGLSTTQRGPLLKSQIRVRTFADWDDVRPGFMEIDLVAHCGGIVGGSHLYSLVLTDIATTWTECLALRDRGAVSVVDGIERVRRLLPFPLLGIDSDCGTEFLNGELIAYCQREEITFTRGRAHRKNDQCYVEQKNGSIVRHLVGYDRYESELAWRQLTEVYRALRLYVRFYQPSMKLVEKQRDGSRTRRRYDAATTPAQRLCEAGSLPAATAEQIGGLQETLDPVRLLGQVRRLQDALWQHAAALPAARVGLYAGPSAVPFDPAACGLLGPVTEDPQATDASSSMANDRERRRYHRTAKTRSPRAWRTRVDPFSEVWDEVRNCLEAAPELTARELLDGLQQRHPGRFTDGQLRALQRRVSEWRRQTLLRFSDPWVDTEQFAGAVLPAPLATVSTIESEPSPKALELITC